MKFKKILKRKIYPAWVTIRRHKGCKVYIMQMNGLYHFQVFCDDKDAYSDKIQYLEFDDCCLAAKEWVNNKILK